jgi:hypothetical protein
MHRYNLIRVVTSLRGTQGNNLCPFKKSTPQAIGVAGERSPHQQHEAAETPAAGVMMVGWKERGFAPDVASQFMV